MFSVFLALSIVIGLWQDKPANADTTSSSAESVEHLRQEADTLFQYQQYEESYTVYQKILTIHSDHRYAAHRIFEITIIYKDRAERAQREGDADHAKTYQQQYQTGTRYALKILTEQFEQALQFYNNVLETDKKVASNKEAMITMLTMIIEIIQDLRNVYEQAPQKSFEIQQIIDKLDQRIARYEKELSSYK